MGCEEVIQMFDYESFKDPKLKHPSIEDVDFEEDIPAINQII